MEKDFIDRLAHHLTKSLPQQLHTLSEDLEKNFKAVLESTFAKMNLVTREEFDAQSAVLEHARVQLKKIQARVDALEKKLGKK